MHRRRKKNTKRRGRGKKELKAPHATYSATKGSVVFRVETEHGRVYDSARIRNFGEEEIYVRFPPSRKLVLITDSVGSADEDWSVWLYPEVR